MYILHFVGGERLLYLSLEWWRDLEWWKGAVAELG